MANRPAKPGSDGELRVASRLIAAAYARANRYGALGPTESLTTIAESAGPVLASLIGYLTGADGIGHSAGLNKLHTSKDDAYSIYTKSQGVRLRLHERLTNKHIDKDTIRAELVYLAKYFGGVSVAAEISTLTVRTAPVVIRSSFGGCQLDLGAFDLSFQWSATPFISITPTTGPKRAYDGYVYWHPISAASNMVNTLMRTWDDGLNGNELLKQGQISRAMVLLDKRLRAPYPLTSTPINWPVEFAT